jgi:ureidoacrylate peracid hydrolase
MRMHKIVNADHVMDLIMARRGTRELFGEIVGPASALVVIDLQNAFMLPGMPLEIPLSRELIPNVNRLARAVRAAGGRVVWIKMTFDGEEKRWSVLFDYFVSREMRASMLKILSRGDPGHALHADLEVLPADAIMEKTRYSAFIQGSSDLDRQLREWGIDTVLITGTVTNVCCESTARDAMMLNYKTVFVSDGNATRTDAEHNATLASILRAFGDVLSTDEIIARLTPGQEAVRRASGA